MAPKYVSYALWSIVGFRLLCPFSFQTVFSFLPFNANPIPQNIEMMPRPGINTGIAAVDAAVNSGLPAASPIYSANPMQIYVSIGAVVWLAGIAAMLAYSIASIILLRYKLRGAGFAGECVYEVENLKSPFVLGFFRAKIYIPAGLKGEDKNYILCHERVHIRRGDHIIKLAAFFVLCLHWFNPLVWLAFALMSADMELSCDERVMKELGGEIKKPYSLLLLFMAARHTFNASPLAFGEGNISVRVKNIMKFKKYSPAALALSLVLAAAIIAGCAGNPAAGNSGVKFGDYTVNMELPAGFEILDTFDASAGYLGIDSWAVNPAPGNAALNISKDGGTVGAISFINFEAVPEGDIDAFKENRSVNYRALYQGFMLGSMYSWGAEYKVVSESESEGAATDLVYYRSDWIDQSIPGRDLTHFKAETVEGDPRTVYYNRGILAYNLDLKRYTAIELDYDSVTDAELEAIAKSVKITA
jgi:beta-lactamase regulating signal transducer with metallopeptidase domain